MMGVSGSYYEVLKLVKSGMTIQNACVVAGINRTKLYKNITKEQKKELRFYKATTRHLRTFWDKRFYDT